VGVEFAAFGDFLFSLEALYICIKKNTKPSKKDVIYATTHEELAC
jgi:hypothetical protein